MAAEDNKATDLVYSESLYLAVPTSSLIHRKASPADLYVRLTTGRLVKLAHKGGAVDVDRLTRLGEKNVQYLYVAKSEFSGVVSELVRGAEKIGELNQVPADIKLAKFFNISESVFTEVIQLPLSDKSMSHCVRIAGEISSNLQSKPDFAKAMQAIVGIGDGFAKHSLSTVLVVNMMLDQLKWNSDKMVNTLTNAAFFHDIGFKELPKELFYKPRLEMSRDEVEIYQTHPAVSMQILSGLNFVNADVLRAVQEHHEIPSGDGFPRRLKGDRVYPLAKVLSFANMLSHEMFDKLQPGQTFNVDDLVARLDGVYAKLYGNDLIKKARGLFKKEE